MQLSTQPHRRVEGIFNVNQESELES